jgi:putative hydrolase of the HAD superfamily
LRAILLDAVGTIIHPRESVGTVYARSVATHGAVVDPVAMERAFRDVFPAMPPPPLRDAPSPDDEQGWWRELVGGVLDHFEATSSPSFDREGCFLDLYHSYERGQAWQVYPEVHSFLERCQAAGLRLGVVSNFDRRLHLILSELDLSVHFESVTISSEIGAPKPSPRIFAAALRALGCPPGEALHIGDDPVADWKGARDAGLSAFELDRKALTLDSAWAWLSSDTAEAN